MMKEIGRSLLVPAIFAAAAVVASAQTIQVNQNNRTIAVTVTDKAAAMNEVIGGLTMSAKIIPLAIRPQ